HVLALSRPQGSTLFFFYSSGDHPDLHSFPTRRSSDLRDPGPGVGADRVGGGDGAVTGHLVVVDEDPLAALLLPPVHRDLVRHPADRKSTRLNSSHVAISYAVFCLKKKK